MKQVEYGFALTNQLLLSEETQLQESIEAQLSHSDGIRGFMVSYLTADESPADQTEVPHSLWAALQAQMESKAAEDLVSLTCKSYV